MVLSFQHRSLGVLMEVPSLYTSNRRAKKVAYTGFQYTKDRDTSIDAGVKICLRIKNRNSKYVYFFYTNQFSTKFLLHFDVFTTNCRSRPNVVVGETSYRPNVAFNQTSFRLNGFRPNVMDPTNPRLLEEDT